MDPRAGGTKKVLQTEANTLHNRNGDEQDEQSAHSGNGIRTPWFMTKGAQWMDRKQGFRLVREVAGKRGRAYVFGYRIKHQHRVTDVRRLRSSFQK